MQVETFMVTGAAGYLASWIVLQLLEAGYTVHGTVRSTSAKDKIQHLLDMQKKFPKQLQLFEADLLQAGSFSEAMQGTRVVIHVASPYLFQKPTDPQKELIQPALDGTQNVLNSVNQIPSVKRVVLTSSIAAMYDNAKYVAKNSHSVVTQYDINYQSTASKNPYPYAKTEAEQLAWRLFAKQARWELVTIHPGAIFGPSLSKRQDATSVDMMIKFVQGFFKNGVPRLWLGLVDVRDVAQAHVRAATKGPSRQRYIVVAESLRLLKIANLIDANKFNVKNKLPKFEVPKFIVWLIAPLIGLERGFVWKNVNIPIGFDASQSKALLDLNYRKPIETINDHIEQLIADGLVEPASD